MVVSCIVLYRWSLYREMSLPTMWSLRTGGHFKKVVVKKDLAVIIQDLFAEYG